MPEPNASRSKSPLDWPIGLVVTIAILAALAVVGGFIWLDQTYLDPGGRGFAGEANDACRTHDGVKWLNAQQGTIICNDGWVVE